MLSGSEHVRLGTSDDGDTVPCDEPHRQLSSVLVTAMELDPCAHIAGDAFQEVDVGQVTELRSYQAIHSTRLRVANQLPPEDASEAQPQEAVVDRDGCFEGEL